MSSGYITVDTLFKLVSVTFAFLATLTGLQALLTPVRFATSFGIPITQAGPSVPAKSTALTQVDAAQSYVCLMGVRQLATGLILSAFAWQHKWTEMATILAVIGFLVAGTDGYYLAMRAKSISKGVYHALPGSLIASLAIAKLWTS